MARATLMTPKTLEALPLPFRADRAMEVKGISWREMYLSNIVRTFRFSAIFDWMLWIQKKGD
jgi:hypothetical protein